MYVHIIVRATYVQGMAGNCTDVACLTNLLEAITMEFSLVVGPHLCDINLLCSWEERSYKDPGMPAVSVLQEDGQWIMKDAVPFCQKTTNRLK